MAFLPAMLLLALLPGAIYAQPTCQAGSTGTIPTVCPLGGATPSAQILANSATSYLVFNLPTVEACASVCQSFAVYQYTPPSVAGGLGSTCVCSNDCSYLSVPPGLTVFLGSSAACAAGSLTDLSAVSPTCPTTCFSTSNFGWAMPFNDPTFEEDGQPYQIGFFRPQIFNGAPVGFTWTGPVCAQRCAAEGATYYQFVESNQPAGEGLTALGYQQGDCACFTACVASTFVNLNAQYANTPTPQAGPIIVSSGAVCACNTPQASCLPQPSTQQLPPISCVNKGRCDVNGIQATQFSCKICNTNTVPAVNPQLSNAELFGYGPISGVLQTSCITPNGEIPGVIMPGSCKEFSYKTTLSQYPFGPVFQSPFPTVNTPIPSSNAGFPLATLSCTLDASKPFCDLYPILTAQYRCSLRNTGTTTMRNVQFACTGFNPLTYYGGLNPDCTLTANIPAGQRLDFGFTTLWNNGPITMNVAGYSTI